MENSVENTKKDTSTKSDATGDTPSRETKRITLSGLSVRQKIYFGFGGLILITLLNMGYTLIKLGDVEKIGKSVIEQRQPAANLFQRIVQDLNDSNALLNGYLLTGQEDQREEFDIIAQDIIDNMTKVRKLEIVAAGEVKNGSLDRAEDLFDDFLAHANRLYTLRDNDQNNRGLNLAQETLNIPATLFLNNTNILISLASADMDGGHEHGHDMSNSTSMETVHLLQELRYNWVQMMSNLRLFITTQGDGHLDNFKNFNEQSGILLNKLSNMDTDIGFGELEEMVELRKTYMENLPAVIDIFKTESWRTDSYLMKTAIRPTLTELRQIFESIADNQLAQASESGHDLTKAQEQISTTTIISIVVALWASILLTLKISGDIVPPIRQLMTAAKQISDGDLNTEVHVTTKDEIGQLGHSFNTMVNDLRAAAINEQNILDELQELNQGLETRVAERTKDLEQSEIKIRAILDNIGEGIIVLDDKGTIESLNPAAEDIFNMSEADAIGLNSALLIVHNSADDDANPEQYNDATDGAFKGSENQQPIEHQGLRSDGEVFPLEIVISSMKVGNRQLRVCILRDVTARKETEETLADAQNQLVDAAHKSGMADMATGVLHNIGNILNSVNLAGEEIQRISGSSKIAGLIKGTDMLQSQENVGEFLANDARGQKLPAYFIKMGKVLNDEINEINKESKALIQKTTMMKEVISTQQSYAKSGFHNETLNIAELVEDALKIQEASLKKWGVKLDKNYADTPDCTGQKSKLLQVITNLVKNAKEAMDDNDTYNRPKEMLIETGMVNDKSIYLTIKDNGCGISEEQLTKIFNHGFTTKETGHGFGLHTCANAMTEMKGALKVDSEGLQKGATFTVTIPVGKAA